MVLFISQIKLPSLVIDVFDIISGLNTPLAMLVSGVYLVQSNIATILTKFNI